VSAYSYPLLVHRLLESGVTRAGERQIISDGLVQYGYQELLERVKRMVSALHAVGVQSGETVAVMDWDTHRYLESFFGIPGSGAALQMVNVRMSPDQIVYTLNMTGAQTIFCAADFEVLLAEISPQLQHLKKVISLDRNDGTEILNLPNVETQMGYEALLMLGDPEKPFDDFDENTIATTFFTTGTTGLPKGVYFTHRQLVLHTMALLSAYAFGGPRSRFAADNVYMPMTPMFHVHAWGFPYAATLGGLKQVYPGRYTPQNLLRLIAEHKVTLTHGVPTVIKMLLDDPAAASTDLSALSMAVGGATVPQTLARRALAKGIDICGGYGMSEACPLISISLDTFELPNDETALTRRIGVGQPVPLMNLSIVDADMNPQPRDGVATGEIVLRAPWLTQEYWGNEEASSALWRGGWLHTGDVGKADASGHVAIADRIKDVIKSGGEWISSLDMENAIGRHPAVAEVAVVGAPDPQWGERALPFVVPKEGMTVNLDDISAQVDESIKAGELPRYASLREIRLIETMPKTSVGKFDKKKLREWI
jgi:fatty-acyl-CoA synthase